MENTTIDYSVWVEDTVPQLVKAVTDASKEGWALAGGVAVVREPETGWIKYLQAMFRPQRA